MSESMRRFAVHGPYDLGRSLLLGDLGRAPQPVEREANPHAGRRPSTGETPRTHARPHEAELARAAWTSEGPGTVHVRVHAGEVEATAWGPGAELLLDAVPSHLGLDDHPPKFEGKLGHVQRKFPGVRRGRTLDVFDLLINHVIRQRVAWRDAVATQVALLRAHGQVAPGPFDLRMPISAAQFLTLSTADLAAFGLERKRAKTILSLSARAEQIRRFAREDDAESFARKLESFTGVGPWTRAMVQGHGLGEHDVVPTGDYELPSMITWFFTGEPRGDDARMLELLEPYRGQRFRVIHLLMAAGITAPRFGPRIRGVRP